MCPNREVVGWGKDGTDGLQGVKVRKRERRVNLSVLWVLII